MVIKRVTDFPFVCYVEIEGKKPDEFIRVNKTENTFTYKGEDYRINQTAKEFIDELETLSMRFFDWSIETLPLRVA